MANISYVGFSVSEYSQQRNTGFDIAASGYSPESMGALLSAYSTLRDRYNSQKTIIRQLQDQLKNTPHAAKKHAKSTRQGKLTNGYARENGPTLTRSAYGNLSDSKQKDVSLNAKDLIEELKLHIRKFEALLGDEQYLSDNACADMSLSLETLSPKFRQLSSPVKLDGNLEDDLNSRPDVASSELHHRLSLVDDDFPEKNEATPKFGPHHPDALPLNAVHLCEQVKTLSHLIEGSSEILKEIENGAKEENMLHAEYSRDSEDLTTIASLARSQQQQLQTVADNLRRQNEMLKFLERHIADQTSQRDQSSNIPLHIQHDVARTNLLSAGEEWSLLTTV